MKDKEIRNILISFLKANSNEIRIYQEKSIGTSVCDLMTVTDKLTGFEIKSDRDNFARLERQVKAYSLFFDKNYIVVGKTHLAGAYGKVPDDWGIICIVDDNVTIERKAKKNVSVSRRKQLSVLWKLELKNLLVKNHLPAYAQKDKGYIADRILERADPENLGRQIADELMRRDYSVFNATDYTEYYSAYDSSEQHSLMELVDTLSEEALESFTLDKWIELYSIAKERHRKKEQVYKAPIKSRTEHKIKYTDNVQMRLKAIHHLDVPWRPSDMVQREGRIIRKGNQNESVMIYRYIAEGSFDSYAWQILETKQNFISQFLSGTSYQRTISDLENNVLTYSEVKALALDQPLMKKLAEKENELKTISILKAQENETLERLKAELAEVKLMISESEKRVSKSKIIAEQQKTISQNNYKNTYKELTAALTDIKNKPTTDLIITSVLGFELSLPEHQDERKPYFVLYREEIHYHLEMGDSVSGNARRIINFFKKFDKTVEREEKRFEELKKRKADIESILHLKKDKYDTVSLRNEINEIRSKLNISQR